MRRLHLACRLRLAARIGRKAGLGHSRPQRSRVAMTPAAPLVEVAVELLLALAAIILIVTVERLHLSVAPAAIMVVGVAAEAAPPFVPLARASIALRPVAVVLPGAAIAAAFAFVVTEPGA